MSELVRRSNDEGSTAGLAAEAPVVVPRGGGEAGKGPEDGNKSREGRRGNCPPAKAVGYGGDTPPNPAALLRGGKGDEPAKNPGGAAAAADALGLPKLGTPPMRCNCGGEVTKELKRAPLRGGKGGDKSAPTVLKPLDKAGLAAPSPAAVAMVAVARGAKAGGKGAGSEAVAVGDVCTSLMLVNGSVLLRMATMAGGRDHTSAESPKGTPSLVLSSLNLARHVRITRVISFFCCLRL